METETLTDYFLGLQKHCGQWLQPKIKRCLLFGIKAMTNLNGILKSRHITSLAKVCIVKAMVFPVVMYGYKSWTMKSAEHQRLGLFKLWCWKRLLRVLWTARRSNQSAYRKSTLTIHCKDWCWSWALIFWLPDVKSWLIPWCWERLKAGEEDGRGWDGWMASLIQWTWVWANSRR